MTYTQERDEFIGLMVAEGVSVTVARKLLSAANTLQKLAELECSSERADRDRVPCPTRFRPTRTGGECLCDDAGSMDHAPDGRQLHGTVPRIAVQAARVERDVERACIPYGLYPVFGGDPRGAVLCVKVPSGKHNGWGGKDDGICVPAKGFTAAQMERICR